MEHFFLLYLLFAFLFEFATAGSAAKCSQPNSSCSTDEQCCSISNGKSYCNLKTERCEGLRYCDESLECPFDDLSKEEIEDVIDIIEKSKSFSSELQFPIVRQQEPNKKLWNSGDKAATERIAYAAVYDSVRKHLAEVLVSLSAERVISIKINEDGIPPMMNADLIVADKLLQNDPRIKQAYERRGLNASNAAFNVWAISGLNEGDTVPRRRVRLIAEYKDHETKYMDWRPVEGLSATIDVGDEKIIDFIDKGNIPVPKAPYYPDNKNSMPTSQDTNFENSAIEIKGYNVKWHSWKFQYSMDPVYGLQLYHIRYVADCEERFLIYKVSLSEMFVPYGASGETWRWRGAFDAGQYGLGASASPLVAGKDVPLNAKLLPCRKLDDDSGEVSELKGCVAVYERDALPLFKHYDPYTKIDESIGGTKMVISFACAIGNYDYILEYIFSMDGSIEVSIGATGIVLLRGVEKKINDPSCIEDCEDYVNENLIAPVHQHYFCYRIDFDIDGSNNMITEINVVNDPQGPKNPDGGAFSVQRTLLQNETFRDSNSNTARFWSVINAQSRNKFNTPRGYSLHAKNIGHTYLPPGHIRLKQAMFSAHPIWVTVHNDTEQGAAGTFSRTGKPGQGLTEYIQNSESLDNADLVVWHTFAVMHAPRPEEFPIMNHMRSGFLILSRNFQSANPNISKCKNRKLA